MNVNTNASNQQAHMKNMDDSYLTQSKGVGRVARETIEMLPPEKQADVQSLLNDLEKIEKRNVLKQIAQIDSSNMTSEDITAAISEIFLSSQAAQAKSSYPSSFSIYA